MPLTVLPSSHQVCSKLLSWLGVVLSERRILRIFLHEPIDSVNAKCVKLEQPEVTYSSNSGTSCWRSRKTRKLPSLAHAGWPIGSPSCPQTINLHCISLRVPSFNECESTYPDFVALGSFPTGCLSSQPSIIGWLIPSLNPKLNIKVSLARKVSPAFDKYLLFFSFHLAWTNISLSDQGQLDRRVLAEDICVWVERFSLLG